MTDIKRVLQVRIEHDTDCRCPNDENGGAWSIYSGDLQNVRDHGRYARKGQATNNWLDSEGNPTIALHKKLSVGLAFWLDYRNEQLHIDIEPQRHNALLVWEWEPGDMGAKSFEDRRNDAQSDLETFNYWLNGECYGYVVTDEDGTVDDSCWGFIGSEHFALCFVQDYLLTHVSVLNRGTLPGMPPVTLADFDLQFTGDADYVGDAVLREVKRCTSNVEKPTVTT